MGTQFRKRERTTVTIGFAAGDGQGVAYAVSGFGQRRPPLRVGFACRPLPALVGRDVAYAALDAVAHELQRRGADNVEFRIEDDTLAGDLAARRALPAPLILPYLKLRCSLNRFSEFSVLAAHDPIARDLTARARAEVSLNVAA